MESVIEKLGKVSVTVEKDYHNSKKEYNKLTIVEEQGAFRTYISRKPVPVGIELTNREYWIPFSSVLESITFDYLKFKQEYGSGEKLEDNSIKTRHIENGAIISSKILDNSISNSKIENDTIEIEKLSAALQNIIKAATGVPEDLAKDITKLMRKVFPLEITVNITPTDLQEKGTSTEIIITWSAKVESEIVTPESVVINGRDITGQTSYHDIVSDSKSFEVKITAEGRVTSVNKSITYVYPIFTGFNSSTEFTGNVSNLAKLELRSSLGTITDTKTNNNTSNYYWIVSPYKVNNVVTSGINIISDFIYTTVEYIGTTYHCYRLNAPSSADTFTFIIS